jgi:hypothetical protein
MYSVQPQLLATVGSTAKACSAFAAIDVWVNRAFVADLQFGSIPGNLNDLARKLMTQDSRIRVNGVAPGEGMEVAATNSDSSNTYEYFPQSCHRRFYLAFDQFAWGIQHNLPHTDPFLSLNWFSQISREGIIGRLSS